MHGENLKLMFDVVHWTEVPQVIIQYSGSEKCHKCSGSINNVEYLDKLSKSQFLIKDSALWS
jgi:hypothetical protein